MLAKGVHSQVHTRITSVPEAHWRTYHSHHKTLLNPSCSLGFAKASCLQALTRNQSLVCCAQSQEPLAGSSDSGLAGTSAQRHERNGEETPTTSSTSASQTSNPSTSQSSTPDIASIANGSNESSRSSSSGGTMIRRNSASALSSLDMLLGSTESLASVDLDSTESSRKAARVQASASSSSWSSADAGERKGQQSAQASGMASSSYAEVEQASGTKPVHDRPFFVYFLYYSYICVYLAHSWLQATDGDLAASVLEGGLVNDHVRVLFGEVWRIITSGFYCSEPWPLFASLAALATVGQEVEVLYGPARFWAIFYLASMTGGLADAVLSELPVTYGPANSVAGLVGALMGHIAASVAEEAARGNDQVEETEVELAMFVNIKVALGQQARAAVNVLVGLVSGAQGLLDIGGSDASGSWIGLTASLWGGLVLGFLVSPSRVPRIAPRRLPKSAKEAAKDANKDAFLASAMGVTTPSSHSSQTSEDIAAAASPKAGLIGPVRKSSSVVFALYTSALAAVLFGWLYEYGNVF